MGGGGERGIEIVEDHVIVRASPCTLCILHGICLDGQVELRSSATSPSKSFILRSLSAINLTASSSHDPTPTATTCHQYCSFPYCDKTYHRRPELSPSSAQVDRSKSSQHVAEGERTSLINLHNLSNTSRPANSLSLPLRTISKTAVPMMTSASNACRKASFKNQSQ